jgi:hypothetical protein
MTNAQWEYLKITSIAIPITFSEINVVEVNTSTTLVENSAASLIIRFGSFRWNTNPTSRLEHRPDITKTKPKA